MWAKPSRRNKKQDDTLKTVHDCGLDPDTPKNDGQVDEKVKNINCVLDHVTSSSMTPMTLQPTEVDVS